MFSTARQVARARVSLTLRATRHSVPVPRFPAYRTIVSAYLLASFWPSSNAYRLTSKEIHKRPRIRRF